MFSPALRNHHDHAIQKARLAGAGSRWEQDGSEPIDLQSLFVAIDQKGYTISEFCEAWPVEDWRIRSRFAPGSC